ncbi:Chromosome initiation inhibitor [compost metagenome]
MFDYKLLAALAAVVEQGGFERGAQVLGLSQSAISQRIKLLEARVGQPVLVRSARPQPTELGQRLLNHVQQVRLLEGDLQQWASVCSTMCSRCACWKATCSNGCRCWTRAARSSACAWRSTPTAWRPGGLPRWATSAPSAGYCWTW